MAIHEEAAGSGECPPPIDFADAWQQRAASAASLTPAGRTLVAEIEVDGSTLQLPVDDIEIERTDDPSNCLLKIRDRVKEGVEDHPVRTAVIIGATVVAGMASFQVAKQVGRSKQKK